MISTQRTLPHDGLAGAFSGLGVYETPLNGYIRAIYTRQPLGQWTYYISQCVFAESVGHDTVEAYEKFTFISKGLREITVAALFNMLGSTGIETAPDLPRICLPKTPTNWTEEIIPSHATSLGIPFRRFSTSVQPNAFFPQDQLVAYDLPYRPSAAGYVKEFLGFKAFHDTSDARHGEFSIEVPDRRGAIHYTGGRICIKNPTAPMRLVGMLNGDVAVDVINDTHLEYDSKTTKDVELWLLTKESDLVDFISSSHWPHKYETPMPEKQREERLLETIRNGESETCEFKPYIDLTSAKASELESTVCAFSNQRGGTLLIGITDDGSVIGIARELVQRPDELPSALRDYENAVRTRLREALKDNQCFTVYAAKVLGVSLVVVEVGGTQDLNYIVKSSLAQTAFIRHGATSFKMSPPEIQAKAGGNSQSILQNSIFS